VKTRESRFVYVTYIRTTAEKLWEALLQPEFTKKYWSGTWQESDWQKGSSWKLMKPDGQLADSGTVEEIEKPKRLVLRWRNEFRPELNAEGHSRCTIELVPEGDTVKLTITHTMDRGSSKLIEGVSNGWPKILASLKSMLETGEPLPDTFKWPKS
jgi:uncharacterized protein YndB with AHSA1/START domain